MKFSLVLLWLYLRMNIFIMFYLIVDIERYVRRVLVREIFTTFRLHISKFQCNENVGADVQQVITMLITN